MIDEEYTERRRHEDSRVRNIESTTNTILLKMEILIRLEERVSHISEKVDNHRTSLQKHGARLEALELIATTNSNIVGTVTKVSYAVFAAVLATVFYACREYYTHS